MNTLTDNNIIERVIKGENELFGILVERYQNWVFTIIYGILKNREDAEETAQDVFLKAYRSLGSFRGSSKFSSWLYRIAFNAAISSKRQKKCVVNASLDSLPVTFTFDEHIQEYYESAHEENLKLMNEVIEKLDYESKTMLKLFYMDGRSVGELSDIFGFSESNVKVKMHRIRKNLLAAMKNHWNYHENLL